MKKLLFPFSVAGVYVTSVGVMLGALLWIGTSGGDFPPDLLPLAMALCLPGALLSAIVPTVYFAARWRMIGFLRT
jgi:hypothetical protein